MGTSCGQLKGLELHAVASISFNMIVVCFVRLALLMSGNAPSALSTCSLISILCTGEAHMLDDPSSADEGDRLGSKQAPAKRMPHIRPADPHDQTQDAAVGAMHAAHAEPRWQCCTGPPACPRCWKVCLLIEHTLPVPCLCRKECECVHMQSTRSGLPTAAL